jgi:hypothetical protein
MAALESFHPSAQPYHVIVDKHQVCLGVSFRQVRGRDEISAIGGEKRQPFIQAPSIQERRFLVKKVFHHLAHGGDSSIILLARLRHDTSPLLARQRHRLPDFGVVCLDFSES